MPSRRAGGSGGRIRHCIAFNPLRLGYILILSAQAACLVKALTSAAAEAFWRKVWHAKALPLPGWICASEPLQVAKLHALESGIEVEYVQETVEETCSKNTPSNTTRRHLYGNAGARLRSATPSTPAPNWLNPAASLNVEPQWKSRSRDWRSSALSIFCAWCQKARTTKKFIKPAELCCWVDKTVLKEHDTAALQPDKSIILSNSVPE